MHFILLTLFNCFVNGSFQNDYCSGPGTYGNAKQWNHKQHETFRLKFVCILLSIPSVTSHLSADFSLNITYI